MTSAELPKDSLKQAIPDTQINQQKTALEA
jgi:hypothetical protein